MLARLAALEPVTDERDGLVWKNVISATMASGGRARNIVPDVFELNLNHRFGPSTSVEDAPSRTCSTLVAGEADVEFVDVSPSAPPLRHHPLVAALAGQRRARGRAEAGLDRRGALRRARAFRPSTSARACRRRPTRRTSGRCCRSSTSASRVLERWLGRIGERRSMRNATVSAGCSACCVARRCAASSSADKAGHSRSDAVASASQEMSGPSLFSSETPEPALCKRLRAKADGKVAAPRDPRARAHPASRRHEHARRRARAALPRRQGRRARARDAARQRTAEPTTCSTLGERQARCHPELAREAVAPRRRRERQRRPGARASQPARQRRRAAAGVREEPAQETATSTPTMPASLCNVARSCTRFSSDSARQACKARRVARFQGISLIERPAMTRIALVSSQRSPVSGPGRAARDGLRHELRARRRARPEAQSGAGGYAGPTSAPGDAEHVRGLRAPLTRARRPGRRPPLRAREAAPPPTAPYRPTPAPPRSSARVWAPSGVRRATAACRRRRSSARTFPRRSRRPASRTTTNPACAPCSGSGYWDRRTDGISTARGAITIRVVDDRGAPLPTFSAGGRSYVMGQRRRALLDSHRKPDRRALRGRRHRRRSGRDRRSARLVREARLPGRAVVDGRDRRLPPQRGRSCRVPLRPGDGFVRGQARQ